MNERIRKLRRHMDMTQQEFADKIGIKRNTIATYEAGRNVPIDAVISLICRTFNVNEKWLRDGEGEMFAQISKENKLMQWAGEVLSEENDSFRHRLISALSVLDDRDLRDLERVLTKMSEELPKKEQ